MSSYAPNSADTPSVIWLILSTVAIGKQFSVLVVACAVTVVEKFGKKKSVGLRRFGDFKLGVEIVETA